MTLIKLLCSPTKPTRTLIGMSAFVLSLFSAPDLVPGQQDEFKQFSATSVFQELDAKSASSNKELVPSWWDQHVTGSLRSQQPLEADIHTLLFLAIQHSNQIKIAKRDPLIRATAIQEADSAFDWVQFLDAAWRDTSEPIGNSLTAGGTATQFNEQTFIANSGFRRLTRYGGLLDISQRLGFQDNNSTFLIPDQQANSQFTVNYTHPLLRGRGAAFNNSLVFLARVDAKVAEHQFMATLQEELLEVTRSYWALYLERAVLAHQMRLFLKTEKIFKTLEARQGVDTQRTQLITASSALENRRSDLIRARTAVTNAETRLRGLINAPILANTDVAELIPVETPSVLQYPAELESELQTAIQSRPEIQAAVQQVKTGATRLGIARHELLPNLNLVTEFFLSGLQGNNDIFDSFTDQFSTGRPSYSLGIQYELPVGNRLAKARLCRRQHELGRLQDEYSRALEAVRTEVDIAVRELRTSYLEISARSLALAAAEAEAETIEQRWNRMVDGNGSAGLNLESLLRAQERVTQTERDYLTSILTYNLAMVNLKRANGTLLNSENVTVDVGNEDGCKSIEVNKTGPSNGPFPASQVTQQSVIDQNYVDHDYVESLPLEEPTIQPSVIEPSTLQPSTLQPSEISVGPVSNEFVPQNFESVPTAIQNPVGGFNVPSIVPEEFVPAQKTAPVEKAVPVVEEIVPAKIAPEQVAPPKPEFSDYFSK